VDCDNDGFLDLYLNGTRANKRLYHNEKNANHWIVIKPVGTTSNRDGIGARVRIVTGNLRQSRDIQGGGVGGITHGMLWAHFGIGSATKVDSIIIRWPRDRVDVVTNVPADKYYTFREGTGITGIGDEQSDADIPTNYALFQNYPNPFNPSTEIRFQIPTAGFVQLKLYDVLGREVATLVNEWKEAGLYTITLDTRHSSFAILPSGVYFYKITANQFVDTKKAVLLQ
jgi:hypothetical protein